MTEPFHAATEWERIAKEQPDTPALHHGGLTRSWREFEERAARLAGAMSSAGLGRGDRVAIDLRNCPEFLETWFAALKQRCTPVAVNYRYLEEELRYLLLDCDARAVVYHASFGERIANLVGDLRAVRIFIEVADETPATVVSAAGSVRYEDVVASGPRATPIRREPTDPTLAYTGGTTGLPKGVEGAIWNPAAVPLLERVHLVPAGEQALATIRAGLRASGSRPVVLPCSPLMHATAMTMVSEPALHLGGTVVTLTSHSLDPDEILDCIERHRVTHLAITGDPIARPLVDALNRLASSGRVPDLSSVRLIASAGVAWSADVKDRLFAYMPDVTLYDACGSTEGATYGFSYLRAGDPTSTSRFTAAPGLVVIDEVSGRPLGVEQPGLLAAPSARDGYAGDPDRSAAVFREIDGEQFTVPGDYGIVHSDGTVTFIGRGSSTINTGGEKVFPEEVEEIIVSITGVADCAVIGVPDPRWGQRVVALVQRSPGSSVDAERVVTAVRQQLASYKAPKDVVFGDVPRTATGKLDRGSAGARVGRAPEHHEQPLVAPQLGQA